LVFAGVAIAIVPPLELELDELVDDPPLLALLALVVLLLEELLLDPHAATTTAETTATKLHASRLYFMCIWFSLLG
jgi:hypothetical protein